MRAIEDLVKDAFKLHGEGKIPEALEYYEKLIGFTDGTEPNVLYAYGTLLAQNEKPGLASFLLGSALKLMPQSAPCWCNYGLAMHKLGRDDIAIKAYLQAEELDPTAGDTLSNIAAFYQNRGMADKAVEYGYKAIAVLPDHPGAHNNLAMGLLELGRFDEAWPHYEYRWSLPDRIKDRRPYKCPQWKGEPVKTLSIHGEQGIGDEILNMGCLKLVRPLTERIIVECTPRLVPWFKESFGLPCYGTHDELITAEGEPDAYISMSSLPMIVGWHDGSAFLRRPEIPQCPETRIGIAWRGGVPKTNKRDRTQKLEALKPILDIPGIEFVSVQYGEENVVGEALQAGLYHGVEGRDLEDLNKWIASCDLVISACQTAVHQAGAMGIPCWVMTPRRASWRYCGDGEQSRFYQSVKLYRQETDGDWAPVIQRIANDVRLLYGRQAKYA